MTVAQPRDVMVVWNVVNVRLSYPYGCPISMTTLSLSQDRRQARPDRRGTGPRRSARASRACRPPRSRRSFRMLRCRGWKPAGAAERRRGGVEERRSGVLCCLPGRCSISQPCPSLPRFFFYPLNILYIFLVSIKFVCVDGHGSVASSEAGWGLAGGGGDSGQGLAGCLDTPQSPPGAACLPGLCPPRRNIK
jgi:hypothetical protein